MTHLLEEFNSFVYFKLYFFNSSESKIRDDKWLHELAHIRLEEAIQILPEHKILEVFQCVNDDLIKLGILIC